MMVEMKVGGLAIDPFTNMPIVILKDLEGQHAVPIWIGLIEASAIATELEKVQLARPMTHDLLKSILVTLGVNVVKIEVNDLKNNTFYASIFLEKNGTLTEVDSRPSDAIALALRTGARIYVAETVIERSQRIDLHERKEGEPPQEVSQADQEKWKELLENLPAEHFPKYKM